MLGCMPAAAAVQIQPDAPAPTNRAMAAAVAWRFLGSTHWNTGTQATTSSPENTPHNFTRLSQPGPPSIPTGTNHACTTTITPTITAIPQASRKLDSRRNLRSLSWAADSGKMARRMVWTGGSCVGTALHRRQENRGSATHGWQRKPLIYPYRRHQMRPAMVGPFPALRTAPVLRRLPAAAAHL